MDDIGIDIDYGGNEYVRIRMGGGGENEGKG